MTKEPEQLSDERIVQYLLADLDDDACARIEEAALSDEALAERIDMALADLLDAHAADRLRGDRARVLNERLARSADLRKRFVFAQALHAKVHTEARKADRSPAVRKLPSRRTAFFGLAMAAALLLLIGVIQGRHATPDLVAAVDLVPAIRGADAIAEVTLPEGNSGIVLARLSLPRDVAAGRGYVVRVALSEREPTYVSPPLDPTHEGKLEVRIPVASLAASRASISVSPADRANDLVAFFELRIRRSAGTVP